VKWELLKILISILTGSLISIGAIFATADWIVRHTGYGYTILKSSVADPKLFEEDETREEVWDKTRVAIYGDITCDDGYYPISGTCRFILTKTRLGLEPRLVGYSVAQQPTTPFLMIFRCLWIVTNTKSTLDRATVLLLLNDMRVQTTATCVRQGLERPVEKSQ
jgi:hypothetical protein